MRAAFALARTRPAAALAAGGLAATMLCGLLVPIYTDEVTWRFQLSRSPFDGGVDRGLGEQCGPNTLLAAPWFMQPMRRLAAYGNLAFADPRVVRLLGVALALAWVALFAMLARRAGRRSGDAGVLPLGLGLLGLGTTPWLLVWSRPEQPILLALTAAILIALHPARTARGAWIRAAGIVLLGVIALGYHPKAVVFLPVVLVAATFSSEGAAGRAPRIGAIALLSAMGVQAFAYWNTRFACPNDPTLAAMLARESAVAAYKAGSLRLGPLLFNAMPAVYGGLARPAIEHMSAWLPTLDQPLVLLMPWRAIVRWAWRLALTGEFVLLGLALLRSVRLRRLDARDALAGAIMATILAWGATQTNKNVYEAALILPLAVIGLALLLPALPPQARHQIGRIGAGVALLALVSEVLLIATYAPALLRTAARPGTIADQPYSFNPWGYAAIRPQILAAGRACAIDPVRARYLLVDDLTYFAYLQSWRPLHRMALLDVWTGAITDPVAYLKGRRSSGAAVQCAVLKHGLRAQARAVGQFCCLGPYDGSAR